MKWLRAAHSVYGLFIFGLLFILLLPFLLVPIIFPDRFMMVGIINRIWAKILFFLCFLPYRVEIRGQLDTTRQYIFCPNHFSYLDIPTMGLNPHNTIFVGKNEVGNIPLFGYMFRKLHITVDRSRLMSKFQTWRQTLEALDEGKSLVIYPEGGIIAPDPPHMAPFKEGPFRAAIEKQIPIVPVTIPYNWIILPDQDLLVRWGEIKVIFHEPISVEGYTMETIDSLKNKVREIIRAELNAQTKKNITESHSL